MVAGSARAFAQPPSLVVDQVSGPAVAPAITVAVGGPSAQVIGQTVTAGVTGRLWAIEVPIGCVDGELTLEIRNVTTSGTPGPVVYSRRVHRPASSPELFDPVVTNEFKRLRLGGPPVRLVAGETFSFVLRNPTSSCGVWPPAADYGGGILWYQGDGVPDWVPFGIPPDLAFRTIMRP
jgi:hypothetical protein